MLIRSLTCLALMFSFLAHADGEKVNYQARSIYALSRLLTMVDLSAQLTEMNESKAACLILQDPPLFGVQLSLDGFQNEFRLKRLPLDANLEAEQLDCRIVLLKTFCAKAELGKNQDAYNRLVAANSDCVAKVNLPIPNTQNEYIQQTHLLNDEVRRILKIVAK